jgi:hypothetical protein
MDCYTSHHCSYCMSKSNLTALLYIYLWSRLRQLRQLSASSSCNYSPRMCSLDGSHAVAAAHIHAMQYLYTDLI